jgi:hypothetical protein
MPPLGIIIIAFFIGTVSGAVPMSIYKDALWKASVAQQKADASKRLADATQQILEHERKNAELSAQIEEKHHAAQQQIDSTLADNRRLAAQLGGLRDPGRRPGSRCPERTADAITAGAKDSAAESGLSAEATEFLLGYAADADRAAEYANTCHSYAVTVAGE